MQVAVRQPRKGNLVALWIHEFFAVHMNKVKTKGKLQIEIYQAMEFSLGGDMPVQCRIGLSEKQLSEIWVKGRYFAPASRSRSAGQTPNCGRTGLSFKKTLRWIGNQQCSIKPSWIRAQSW